MAQGTATVKVITTAGKKAKQDRLTASAVAAFTYVALGTGNTSDAAIGDTTLTSETAASGLARATVTPTVSAAGVASWSKLFQNTSAASVVVSEIGILNASSNGTLFMHITLGTANFITLAVNAYLLVTVTDAET